MGIEEMGTVLDRSNAINEDPSMLRSYRDGEDFLKSLERSVVRVEMRRGRNGVGGMRVMVGGRPEAPLQ